MWGLIVPSKWALGKRRELDLPRSCHGGSQARPTVSLALCRRRSTVRAVPLVNSTQFHPNLIVTRNSQKLLYIIAVRYSVKA